jgi:3-deoxy-D-manno-octulosonic-acid transferase
MHQPTQLGSNILWMAAGPRCNRLGAVTAYRLTALQRALYGLYVVGWLLGLPWVLLYFWWRGRKEPLYRQFWAERFGRVDTRLLRPIWLHGASLGELRGVMPLIDELLQAKFPVLITTLTPAGRSAITQRYAQALAQDQLQVSYLPLELPWVVKRFAKRLQVRCMISSEIDTWPVLLHTLRKMGLPLAFVNAGYPQKSFEADRRGAGFRAAFFRAYDLILCKSDLHAQRFLQAGCPAVKVVGELRFDSPIPDNLIDCALALKASDWLSRQRPVLALASVVESEDEGLIAGMKAYLAQSVATAQQRPLWIYVPRSPQRFEAVHELLIQAGLRVTRRSQSFSADLKPYPMQDLRWDDVDVLLGDSLGEMYFYLSLADHVTVLGSFTPKGSHNVIEPLALQKPVAVGPVIWTIEYPAQEALAAGVLKKVQSFAELPDLWASWWNEEAGTEQAQQRAQAFIAQHSGSVAKHWQHLQAWLRV